MQWFHGRGLASFVIPFAHFEVETIDANNIRTPSGRRGFGRGRDADQSGWHSTSHIGGGASGVDPARHHQSDSLALLGRTSIGSGGPEQVDVGLGISLAGATLVADGLDHAVFPVISSLPIGSELVISNQGSPMLMQASLLRGLFSAGQNVAIDPNGVISSSLAGTSTGDGRGRKLHW